MAKPLGPYSYQWGGYVGTIFIIGPILFPQATPESVYARLGIVVMSIAGGIGVLRRTQWGAALVLATLVARQVSVMFAPGFPVEQWRPLLIYTGWLVVNAIYFGKRWAYLTGPETPPAVP